MLDVGRSLSGRRWLWRGEVLPGSERLIAAIAQRCDLPEIVGRLLHVRGIRQLTIGRDNRAQRSIEDHHGIIAALERRETELAERLSREHTLRLAAYVDEHGDELFG